MGSRSRRRRAGGADVTGQLALFAELPRRPRRAATDCRSSSSPVPPLHRVRRLSYSALALFERCSYRYYTERIAGLREERGRIGVGAGLAGDRGR